MAKAPATKNHPTQATQATQAKDGRFEEALWDAANKL